MPTLLEMHCQHQSGPALSASEITHWLSQVPGWDQPPGVACIQRTFRFGDFHETMAFINAVAGIAHREDHHPDLEVGYNRCVARFSTHSVGGLSLNDFICAAQINVLAHYQNC